MYLETRMSKGSSTDHFGYIFFQSRAFFFLMIMKGRQTRRLKAEIAYFQKIKFLGPIEYSNMAEYASKVHYGGRKLPREPCGNLWEK